MEAAAQAARRVAPVTRRGKVRGDREGKGFLGNPREQGKFHHDDASMASSGHHEDHERWMRVALQEARAATEHGDVPIGAVVVHDDGRVLGRGRNERELREDPTAHAEVLALREAAAAVGSWRVLESTLYVTLEPCTMCAGAIVLSRIPRVVFATVDPKAGAAGSVLDVLADTRLNHRPEVVSGILADEAADLLRSFFRARR
jgi:tRNA(adenine34) deaminase